VQVYSEGDGEGERIFDTNLSLFFGGGVWRLGAFVWL